MNAVLDGLPLEQTDLGLEFENSDAKIGRSASGSGKRLEFENSDNLDGRFGVLDGPLDRTERLEFEN